MLSKLVSIGLSFLFLLSVTAQSDFTTLGKYQFVDEIRFADSVEITPGQLNKSGNTFYIGLRIDADSGNHYDIYKYDLKGTLIPLQIPTIVGYKEIHQPTVNGDERCLIVGINSFKGWASNDLMECIMDKSGEIINTRILSELNAKDTSDAYPWISSDGLRIYYTREDGINYSSRKSIDATFNAPAPLKFEGIMQIPVVSCWLTTNEKQIFFISNNTIYNSKRKNKKKKFPLPTVHTSEFVDFDFIAGLSFSPDLKQLYLYYSGDSSSILHYYKKK